MMSSDELKTEIESEIEPEVEAETTEQMTITETSEDGTATETTTPVAADAGASPEPEGEDLQANDEASVEIADEASVEIADEAGEIGETENAQESTLETEEERPALDDDREWYVIHCYSGYEKKVKHNLEQRIDSMQMEDLIFQVVIPTEDEMEVRDGKRRVIERRVFPGYILVQMRLTDDSWFVVRNTPGVTGFVGMGNDPTPLRAEEVQSIMHRMESEAPKIKVTFKPGQKVRIVDGPFNEFIGVVDEIDMDRAKVRVMVSFFGRETPVELDFLQVEKT